MELVKLQIPPEFVRERAQLTWREVLFGIENDLLSSDAATEFAAWQLTDEQAVDPGLIELAGLSEGEPFLSLVQQLAAAEPHEDLNEIRSKWLYLVLAWLLEHKDRYSDPLRAIEEVYADFGYPESMAGFVRYMPMAEPDLGSKEANEQRLYDKWRKFVNDASAVYRR